MGPSKLGLPSPPGDADILKFKNQWARTSTVNELVLKIAGPVHMCLDEKYLKRVLKNKIQVVRNPFLFTHSTGLEWGSIIWSFEQIPLVNPTNTSTEIKGLDGL